MIIKASELLCLPEFSGQDAETLQGKIDAIESLIRSYTNNNFQNRAVRFWAASIGGRLQGASTFLRIGDTVQISQSSVNDGLYIISNLSDGDTVVDRDLFEIAKNLVTKVEYPSDVKAGVIHMLQWEQENRRKVGIKSETLSRHSVTYYDQDASNQVMGYPVSLLGFLQPYMKARF
ncbi:MAG: hypothetical protein QM793_06755 [Muricomes sp.]